jgi:membrane peptidoglycan carboxypeptidase|tara:strand:- start:1100 stop:1411 length:312 start_codon:yes stop_codon:yes gene_type:complete
MSQELKTKALNNRFNEWLKKCPVEYKETKHPSEGLVSFNFDMDKYRDVSKYNTIEASGHYLTEYLPEDYENWDDEKLYKFCEDHAHYLYEGMDGESLFDEINR